MEGEVERELELKLCMKRGSSLGPRPSPGLRLELATEAAADVVAAVGDSRATLKLMMCCCRLLLLPTEKFAALFALPVTLLVFTAFTFFSAFPEVLVRSPCCCWAPAFWPDTQKLPCLLLLAVPRPSPPRPRPGWSKAPERKRVCIAQRAGCTWSPKVKLGRISIKKHLSNPQLMPKQSETGRREGGRWRGRGSGSLGVVSHAPLAIDCSSGVGSVPLYCNCQVASGK